jgi:hypothetical protein
MFRTCFICSTKFSLSALVGEHWIEWDGLNFERNFTQLPIKAYERLWSQKIANLSKIICK